MEESPLAKKMKLKAGQRVALVNAPADYLQELSPLPAGVEVSHELQGEFDWIQLFARNKAELAELAPPAIAVLKPESLLWLSFPKGSSGMQTDLTRDQGWEVVEEAGLKWVNLVSVNTTWSAFAVRRPS